VDLSKIKKIYMIGIKGVGMTMLAEFLAHEGYEISGSDLADKFMTDEALKKAGIKVFENFDAKHLDDHFDLVVYSTAYNESNLELKTALEKKYKVATFAEVLGAVFNTHKGIAVCGSHGKTTVSAWLGFVLEGCGLEPNVMVGARVPQFKGSSLIGKSNLLVIEADEYQNKLQYFSPKVIVLNNIDYDHPDFFPDMESYEEVFAEFIAKLPKSGLLIANFDDSRVRRLAGVCLGRVVSYGFGKGADYIISEAKQDYANQYFVLKLKTEDGLTDIGSFRINLLGKHNIANAAAVIVTAIELGADLNDLRRSLEEFTGTARRLQTLGTFRGALILDDYAHHPTEIKTTLEGVRKKYPKKNLRVVFHPHTFSRTEALLNDFAGSFLKANEVIVLNIYASAREAAGTISGEDVARAIAGQAGVKQSVKYLPTLEEAEDYLRSTANGNDVIVLMGAGDVFRIGENLLGLI